MKYHTKLTSWLLVGPLAPYTDAFAEHLSINKYSPSTANNYIRCFAHFSHWANINDIDVHEIDEQIIKQFLDEHFPDRVSKQETCYNDYHNFHASLKHILTVLRANTIIPASTEVKTPVDKELTSFDDYMNDVRGLAPNTRRHYLGIIRQLLVKQFASHAVVIQVVKPDDVRQFISGEKKRYVAQGSISLVISALRSYFRFRKTCGDQVNHLIGVANFPANWQLASLPRTLNKQEVECLLKALDYNGKSARRTKAIVHCALDLGLRSIEIANLGLDDINWQAGTITLKKTKGRREDLMPLPEATGSALADYLRFERPKTIKNRSVFVHSTAPREQPVAPDLIRHTIRQAYARAGLPYTRAHLLRHTMASRLLEKGSSLKEVADVLRHRSLNTTMIYAKLDSRTLVEVALPWPGSKS